MHVFTHNMLSLFMYFFTHCTSNCSRPADLFLISVPISLSLPLSLSLPPSYIYTTSSTPPLPTFLPTSLLTSLSPSSTHTLSLSYKHSLPPFSLSLLLSLSLFFLHIHTLSVSSSLFFLIPPSLLPYLPPFFSRCCISYLVSLVSHIASLTSLTSYFSFLVVSLL